MSVMRIILPFIKPKKQIHHLGGVVGEMYCSPHGSSHRVHTHPPDSSDTAYVSVHPTTTFPYQVSSQPCMGLTAPYPAKRYCPSPLIPVFRRKRSPERGKRARCSGVRPTEAEVM